MHLVLPHLTKITKNFTHPWKYLENFISLSNAPRTSRFLLPLHQHTQGTPIVSRSKRRSSRATQAPPYHFKTCSFVFDMMSYLSLHSVFTRSFWPPLRPLPCVVPLSPSLNVPQCSLVPWCTPVLLRPLVYPSAPSSPGVPQFPRSPSNLPYTSRPVAALPIHNKLYTAGSVVSGTPAWPEF